MLRALVLIVALIFFRSMISRKRRLSSSAVSPYMNSLDGMMSAEQVSQALDNYAGLRSSEFNQSTVSRSR